jgi:hypothetical protein
MTTVAVDSTPWRIVLATDLPPTYVQALTELARRLPCLLSGDTVVPQAGDWWMGTYPPITANEAHSTIRWSSTSEIPVTIARLTRLVNHRIARLLPPLRFPEVDEPDTLESGIELHRRRPNYRTI